MSNREFIALGTSSQVPTRERSHNAYLLLWEGEGFLLDPGESAQRQLTFAGIAPSSICYVCITHFHGDHCLGFPGIIQRLSLDSCSHPVHVFYPEEGQEYVDRLCDAALFQRKLELIFHPIRRTADQTIEIHRSEKWVLKSHPLDHSIPTVGYRLEELPARRFVPEKLEAAGIRGPLVGELQRKGCIEVAGRTIRLEDVTVPHEGSVFGFVMDTRLCDGSIALAEDADLVVMEATYTAEHRSLADLYRHSTASDAAEAARRAGARRLALTHFSQRYADAGQHLIDSREIFPNVVALNDLDRLEIPRRR